MKSITSVHNQEIKSVAALKSAKERRAHGRFIAEGVRVVSTFVQAGWTPLTVYTTQGLLDQVEKIVPISCITLVSDAVMNKMSQAATPSQVLAVFGIPAQPALSQIHSGLVLANVSDPGNVGTLIRTCAAMNVQSVLVIDGVDIWHPKVVQASAGALAYVTIKHCSWQELSAHKGDRKLYALTVSGGVSPEAVNADQVLLVVGNEAHGIPDHAVALCDGSITIPMPGNTESLNAAVAGSIALYQVFGQLRKS